MIGDIEYIYELGALRSFATKDDLKGPALCPSHEIKHMAVKKEAMIRLREEMNLSLVKRPIDLQFVPILRSTSICEKDREISLLRHRRLHKQKKAFFCFCCKRFPFRQALSSDHDQRAHYKNCPPAIEFERKVELKMETLRNDTKVISALNRKRLWDQSQNSQVPFSKRSAKERSEIVCHKYELPQFPSMT